MRCDAGLGALLWWSFWSPVAHSCGLLNLLNSFCRGMFKLNAKFDVDSLLYSLSHFVWHGHTVHMFIQLCLLPPLTRIVKWLLLMHAHSILLYLAARLHWCGASFSQYINSGWTFSDRPCPIFTTVIFRCDFYHILNFHIYVGLFWTLYLLHRSVCVLMGQYQTLIRVVV